MTTTTIKVSSTVRDRLKLQAAADDRTLGEQIEYLVELGDRQNRLAAMREAMSQTPPEAKASYQQETSEWAAIDA